MGYKQDEILALARSIRAAGFRAFIAASGEYGFYTDAEGSRVISFGIDLGRLRFSGNYISDQPTMTGTGWVIGDGWPADFGALLNSHPPSFAVGSSKWKFTTLDRYLKTYQASSRFTELEAKEKS